MFGRKSQLMQAEDVAATLAAAGSETGLVAHATATLANMLEGDFEVGTPEDVEVNSKMEMSD